MTASPGNPRPYYAAPPPPYPYGPPRQYGPPPAGLPPNTLPPYHRQHGWPPSQPAVRAAATQPQAAQAPAPTGRRRNREAIYSVICAAVGLLLFTVPPVRAFFGVAAVTLGVIADVNARKRGAPLGRLGLLGALLGILEITAWLLG